MQIAIRPLLAALITGTLLTGCRTTPDTLPPTPKARTFTEDVAFLRQHTEAIVLERDGGKVVVAPAYQGRVMTSSVGDADDMSFGWLNDDVIAAGIQPPEMVKGTLKEHIYVFGGEERFWLGPEGGQFAIYFEKGEPFDFTHWNTPAVIDSEPFELVRHSASDAQFVRNFTLTNYSGYTFDGRIQRRVTVLGRAETEKALKSHLPPSVLAVAYRTRNVLKNTGPYRWSRDTGLLSIWLLGMYKPGATTTVVIPFKRGSEAALGPVVNDAYFGRVPAERLIVTDQALYFSADGTYRSKIGLTAKRSKGIAGSYDADGRVLTVVAYNQQPAAAPYVNSMWALQDAPYAGDVINAYNDGAPEPGTKPLGPFYEIETSSPGAELEAGESVTHVQTTAHLRGPEAELDALARRLFGVSLETIKTALP